MDKVPPGHAFLDISDYARPAARWLVRRLVKTRVTPVQLTFAFVVAGLAAALLFALDRWLVLAACLLLLKSGLDAADGALARARCQPSRVGRFLDSIGDFVVNVAVYAGIAYAAAQQTGRLWPYPLALIALLSGLLHVSVFNHFYLRYRAQTGGDQTSQLVETETGAYPQDSPVWVPRLQRLYRYIYGWQDDWVAWAVRAAGGSGREPGPGFLTTTTVLGLGTQLLAIAVCAVLGRPLLALLLIATGFNAYAFLVIVWYRRRVS